MFTVRFIRLSVLAASVAAVLALPAVAQRPDGSGLRPQAGGIRGIPMPVGPRAASGLDILASRTVRRETELLDKQQGQLNELGERFRNRIRDAAADLRDFPPDERRETMLTPLQQERAGLDQERKSIPTDQQFERLRQLRLQQATTADELAAADRLRTRPRQDS